MASQVPYTPRLEVAPAERPVSPIHVDAPIGAFGGDQAAALQRLGQTVGSVGTELFDRANSLQVLNQQAQASEAASAYVTKLGDLHADYTSQQGKNAIDGYQPFVDATETARADTRASLSSPIAQRAYDQETRNMQSRAIWSGSSHLAEQNKQYLSGASNARMDAADNYALAAPTDEASFQAGLKTKQQEVDYQATLHGWSDDVKKDQLQKANDSLYSARIQSLAKSQPFTAQKLLDDATSSGNLSAQSAARLGSFVQTQRYNVGSRQVASNIMAGGDTSLGEQKLPIDRALEAVRANETTAQGNYSLIHPAAPNGDHALGAYGVMSKNLPGWLAEAGMPPMTQAQFLQSPEAQDKLVGFKIDQYMKEGGTFNAALNKWFTGSYTPKAGANDGNMSAPAYVQKANAYLARTASAGELDDHARTVAQKMAPDDPGFGDAVSRQTQIQYGNQQRIQKEDEFNNSQLISNALAPGKDGKLPTSVEDLTQDPKVKAAWDGLKWSDQLKYLKVLQGNIKNEYDWTPQTSADYKANVGIAKDPARSVDETNQFLQTDFASKPWPWAERKEMLTVQKQMFNDKSAEPQLGHAFSVIAPMMEDAGLNKTTGDKAGYLQFTADFHDVYQSFLDNNKRKPSDDDIKMMGSQIMSKVKEPGKWWGTNETPLYQIQVPDEARKSIVSAYRQRNGVEPPESIIHSAYVAAQYQQLYGPKKAQPAKPNVPVNP